MFLMGECSFYAAGRSRALPGPYGLLNRTERRRPRVAPILFVHLSLPMIDHRRVQCLDFTLAARPGARSESSSGYAAPTPRRALPAAASSILVSGIRRGAIFLALDFL